MQKTLVLIIAILFQFASANAQTVTGIVTDSNGVRLSGLTVQLYSMARSVSTKSDYNGMFILNFPTDVKENQLPLGYSISNNYPNPFNPKTRIDFKLPKASNIKMEIYNVAGQKVRNLLESDLPAGNSFLDIELEGLPNGLYFARILVDESYSITKKLMLLYGSQHLNKSISFPAVRISKQNKDIFIDSLVITGNYIKRKSFNLLKYLTNQNLDLGILIVEKIPAPPPTPCPGLSSFDYGGKKYNTVQIGSQCWMKENLDIGIMIDNSQISSDNHIYEKYCYNNDRSYCNVYGGLYRWNEAMQYSQSGEMVKGLCPEGWHLPSISEFYLLLNTSDKATQSFLQFGQANGQNTSGFSGLLTGVVGTGYTGFSHLGINGYLWSSNENGGLAYFLFMGSFEQFVYVKTDNKGYGLSIRCIKN